MKNRKSQQRNMKEEKDQMEILTLIKYSSQNKKLSGWAQEQNEGEKERISELEDRPGEIAQSKQQTENRWRERGQGRTEPQGFGIP